MVVGGNVIVVVTGGATGSVDVDGSVVVVVVVGVPVDVVGDVGVCFVPPVPRVWSARK